MVKLATQWSVVSTKTPAVWALPTKGASAWKMNDGFTTFGTTSTDTRTTATGDTRITETSDTRIVELSTAVPKAPTIWSAN